jgi:tryptophan synthase beta subunit
MAAPGAGQHGLADDRRHRGTSSSKRHWHLPEVVQACIGADPIDIFCVSLDDPVELIGVEPFGRGTAVGEHAAMMTYGPWASSTSGTPAPP